MAGVSLGAEKKQWVLSNHFVGDNLELELTPFSFTVSGGGEGSGVLPMHSPRALLRRCINYWRKMNRTLHMFCTPNKNVLMLYECSFRANAYMYSLML